MVIPVLEITPRSTVICVICDVDRADDSVKARVVFCEQPMSLPAATKLAFTRVRWASPAEWGVLTVIM